MMRTLLSITVSTLLLCIFSTGGYAMGSNKGWYDAGTFTRWQCTFERDHVPPIAPGADALFQEARALQKSTTKFTSGEKEHIFTLYTQAAQLGHWKAMQHLVNCYFDGFGTQKNYEEANKILDAMIADGIPSGYYIKYVILENGEGVNVDKKKAMEFLHQAADAGYPLAQHKLGYHFMYPKHNSELGMRYFVCAFRQGYAESAREIAMFFEMHENYLMAVEYYYRALALGNSMSGIALQVIFMERGGVTDPRRTFGFQANPELSAVFLNYSRMTRNTKVLIPDLFERHPIPNNTVMTREQSRAKSSAFKQAFGGKWPDEVFPELAPGYIPPKY